jgi:hypothetical protein
MPEVSGHIDRRRQPQVALQAVKHALAEIDWQVAEITMHKFISPRSGWVNESYGYALKVPKKLPVKELWLGFISHQKAPPGIYAQLTPDMGVERVLSPADVDYKISDFGKYILMKQIVPLEQIRRMEKKFGADALTKQFKNILRKVYPFSARKKGADE